MAKFYGLIGFAISHETALGVWEDEIVEHEVVGDVMKVSRRLENSSNLNDNINIKNTLSIVCDAFAYENFCNMRYVKWMGSLWKITDVEIQSPRLILTIGGLYNANQT